LETVTVYRLDDRTKEMIPLGILVERRKTERGKNPLGMLKLARKEFAETEDESKRIFIKYE
jgi:hypothetical protein